MSIQNRCSILLLLIWGLAAPALADDASVPTDTSVGAVSTELNLAYEDRIAELERVVQVMASELQRTREDIAVPEDAELKSSYGMGPAASKVYGLARGLSIGGYGEAFYRKYVGDKTSEQDTTDFLRAVMYFGYKFSDSIIFNSEFEIEHADEIFVEFAHLDFMWKDWMNMRAGMMLIPVGFLNLMHEPTTYYGVNRPDVERFIIPSTWRENGIGIFGNLSEDLSYKLYALNSFDNTGFSPSGIRGGRQKGSKALAEHIAFMGRLDWTLLDGLLVGASFWTGKTGQNQSLKGVNMPYAWLTLFEVHAQYQWRNLWLRGLFTQTFMPNADNLTEALQAAYLIDDDVGLSPTQALAEEMLGAYGEIAVDIMPFFGETVKYLAPFYRFEYYDTQYKMASGFNDLEDDSFQVISHTVGIQFKPIPNVVIKGDYRNRDSKRGKIADEINLGIGYVF